MTIVSADHLLQLFASFKVRKTTKIRKRYNQVPHLTHQHVGNSLEADNNTVRDQKELHRLQCIFVSIRKSIVLLLANIEALEGFLGIQEYWPKP